MKYLVCGAAIAVCCTLSARAEVTELNSVEQYKESNSNALKQAEALLEQVERLDGSWTVETVLEPLNDLAILMGNNGGSAGLYYNVHPDAAMREAAKNQEQALSELGSRIYLSRAVFDALINVESPADPQARRVLERTLRDFRRSGVDRSEEVRKKIRQLIEELTKLGQEFSKNLREDVRGIDVDPEEGLAGLPDDYIATHPPGSNGLIRITTDYTDYLPFMRFARSNELRRQLYMQNANRGYPSNQEVLQDILMKRYEMATLLGYPNYAEYIAETRMIGQAGKIGEFIDQVADIARPRAEKEYAELLARFQQIDPDAEELKLWQVGYISEILRREKYDVDSKLVRTYFRYGQVHDGILKLTSRLFGIEFRPWQTPTWHEDVEAYEIVENGEVIGRFYLDMHPRKDKYKHAAHFGFQNGIADRQLPISALVCNFPGADDADALMEHSDVETFLHEFGHLLHFQFSGRHHWVEFAGGSSERDFIEAPSQMLEEWIWNAEALTLIAQNKEGEGLPDELLEKMVAAREFGQGLFVNGQMTFAAVSYQFYSRDPVALDLAETQTRIYNEYSIFGHVPDTHRYASFGHLYGYSAAYYTYMWSLVISKDLLSRFEEEGMMNPAVSRAYRKAILDPGGSRNSADLVETFLGRPYRFEPFARWLNDPVVE